MSQLNSNLSLTWDLESIFPGGAESPELKKTIADLEQETADLEQFLKQGKVPESVEETSGYDSFLTRLESLYSRLGEAGSFAGCLTAQNTNDKKAIQLGGKLMAFYARVSSLTTRFEAILRSTPDQVFEQWMARPEIAPISFKLTEIRNQAKEKMSPEMESLVLDLAVDGYHGWGDHYDTVVSKFVIETKDDEGNDVKLSAGQAHNRLHHPDRAVREATFKAWEAKWAELADFGADTLNHLAGFRLKLYEKRGWEDVLKEPLEINRMERQTLDAMWQAIDEAKPILVQYLERKAKLLGVEKLDWTDVEAPLGGKDSGKISYEQAAASIVKEFGNFSPNMAEFAIKAFNESWIEAEDRPGKRPGGFCTTLPESKESRIFMTYGGTASNVSTLAHELGHAYHSYLLKDMSVFNEQYAMNVAETASTLAENILTSAQFRQAESKEEKVKLLEEKIQNAVTFFMNIHARFLFETRLYAKRKEGLLSAEELSDLMEEAQKEAFCGALASYHPHFWISKLHFYGTDMPFYNFPYTFGYLFSNGIYARAQEEGPSFAEKYDALLRDTGIMRVEDLAAKHLNIDLTKPDFWREAVKVSTADIELFLEMTE